MEGYHSNHKNTEEGEGTEEGERVRFRPGSLAPANTDPRAATILTLFRKRVANGTTVVLYLSTIGGTNVAPSPKNMDVDTTLPASLIRKTAAIGSKHPAAEKAPLPMMNSFRLDVKLVTTIKVSSAMLERRPELLSLLRSPIAATSVKEQGPETQSSRYTCQGVDRLRMALPQRTRIGGDLSLTLLALVINEGARQKDANARSNQG